jgi:hypothetical protein
MSYIVTCMVFLTSMTTLFHLIIFYLYATIKVYGCFGSGLGQFLGPPLGVVQRSPSIAFEHVLWLRVSSRVTVCLPSRSSLFRRVQGKLKGSSALFVPPDTISWLARCIAHMWSMEGKMIEQRTYARIIAECGMKL